MVVLVVLVLANTNSQWAITVCRAHLLFRTLVTLTAPPPPPSLCAVMNPDRTVRYLEEGIPDSALLLSPVTVS